MEKRGTVGVVDIHSHILPGLDDGSSDMRETLIMLRTAWEEGITDIVATPHYRVGNTASSPAMIAEAVRKVQAAANEKGIPIRIYEGNEILYFNELPEYLREGRVCTLNKSRSVLVEFLPNVQFRSIQNAADSVMEVGYQMILAHAERYLCLTQSRKQWEFLREFGVQIQVNASSVTGNTGGKIKRFVNGMLKAGLVDYIGTDAHGSEYRRPEIAKCGKLLAKRYGREYALSVLRENAVNELGVCRFK